MTMKTDLKPIPLRPIDAVATFVEAPKLQTALTSRSVKPISLLSSVTEVSDTSKDREGTWGEARW